MPCFKYKSDKRHSKHTTCTYATYMLFSGHNPNAFTCDCTNTTPLLDHGMLKYA